MSTDKVVVVHQTERSSRPKRPAQDEERAKSKRVRTERNANLSDGNRVSTQANQLVSVIKQDNSEAGERRDIRRTLSSPSAALLRRENIDGSTPKHHSASNKQILAERPHEDQVVPAEQLQLNQEPPQQSLIQPVPQLHSQQPRPSQAQMQTVLIQRQLDLLTQERNLQAQQQMQAQQRQQMQAQQQRPQSGHNLQFKGVAQQQTPTHQHQLDLKWGPCSCCGRTAQLQQVKPPLPHPQQCQCQQQNDQQRPHPFGEESRRQEHRIQEVRLRQLQNADHQALIKELNTLRTQRDDAVRARAKADADYNEVIEELHEVELQRDEALRKQQEALLQRDTFVAEVELLRLHRQNLVPRVTLNQATEQVRVERERSQALSQSVHQLSGQCNTLSIENQRLRQANTAAQTELVEARRQISEDRDAREGSELELSMLYDQMDQLIKERQSNSGSGVLGMRNAMNELVRERDVEKARATKMSGELNASRTLRRRLTEAQAELQVLRERERERIERGEGEKEVERTPTFE